MVTFADNLEPTFGGVNKTPTYGLWAQYNIKNWNEGMNKKLQFN